MGANMTLQKKKKQRKYNVREGSICLKCETDFEEDSKVL